MKSYSYKQVQEALEVLNNVDCELLGEAVADNNLQPEALAIILMQHLPEGSVPVTAKLFWTRVAEELGPDWIDSLRTVSLFMRYLDKFRVNE